MDVMRSWSSRRWAAALVGSLATALLIGLPTAVIPNPVFGRPVDVTWWSYPVLVVTAVLGGLLIATYVRQPEFAAGDGAARSQFGDTIDDELDRPGATGSFGGLLSFFAVGCPTCNKLVVVAVGSTGALDWFAPAQPVLAALSIVLLSWALRARLRNETSCPIAA